MDCEVRHEIQPGFNLSGLLGVLFPGQFDAGLNLTERYSGKVQVAVLD